MRGGRITRRILATAVAGASAATLALVVVAGSSGAPPQDPGSRDRATVLAYWTPGRVARAVPREVSPDRLHSVAKPRRGKPPGGPGGGGGSDSGTSVTVAAWTGGGKVKATTGKVLFTMGGVDYVCSGAVARDESATTSLILTAGHCVYDEAGGDFATNWRFVPDYEDGGSIITNPDGSHAFSCDRGPIRVLDGDSAGDDDRMGSRWREPRPLQPRLRVRGRRCRWQDGREQTARRHRRRQ